MYLLLFVAAFLLQQSQAEIFTSMADMEQMVLSEKHMLAALKTYIAAEEEKLDEVKKFMARVSKELSLVNKSDVGRYLGNPVNSYLMLKRFNVDWKNLERTLETDFAEGFNMVFENMKPYFPTSEDHEGAMDALFRLQTTYKLNAESLAKGIIPGVTQISTHPLNLQERYELGRYAYNKKKWNFSVEWFTTALEELGDRLSYGAVQRSDIIDYLAYSLFQLGEVRKAYKLTLELAQLRPDEQRILDNVRYFHNELRMAEASKRGDTGDDLTEKVAKTEPEVEKDPAVESREEALRNYEALCRGEVRDLSPSEQRKMKCWYRNSNPILRYKPQKVERLWVTPEIFLFRDIITDKQIDWIKNTSYPQLRRATIQDPITGKLRYADYRVSKSAWLDPYKHSEVRQLQRRAEASTGLDLQYAGTIINNRTFLFSVTLVPLNMSSPFKQHVKLQRAVIQDPITDELRFADYRISKSAWLSADMHPEVKELRTRASASTGLDLAYAEHLQIANYGIGGHYEPHFDHARDDEDKFTDLGMGNRIATLLFYLSDVAAGGPTVFTRARAAVYPSKNDAVFWYNLHRNGEGNVMTRHAACPVLVGQKWVSNWWIHEYGQFLKRKCALNKDW